MAGKKKITGALEVSGSIVSIEEPLIVETKKILWGDLVALRDAGELIPGQQYRITNYITTTVQENTASAGHQFDIIVTADSADKLNENARACHHDFSGPVTELVPSHTYAFDFVKFAEDNEAELRAPNENDILVIKVSSAISEYNGESYNPLLDNYVGYRISEAPMDKYSLLYYANSELNVHEDAYETGAIEQFTVIELITYSQGNLLSIYPYLTDIAGNYFANSKLEAWKLMYCLDNDTDRFAWADTVNGKGVIYRMVDEFNNDVPYDFKNIQFKRKLTDGELDLDSGTDTWVYTFTMSDLIEGKVVDISLKQNTEYIDDEGQYRECANNSVKEAILDYQLDGLIRIRLNDNVFLNIFDDNVNYNYYGCYSNTFGNNCYDNTFGNRCYSNNFGNGCSSNTFGNYCQYNTFGNSCSINTFGNGCYSNIFGNDCKYNVIDNDCYSNTFGNGCNSNIFGYNCGNNIFGNNCNSNNFGNDCTSNTFGNACNGNTFGYSCSSNTFGDYCEDNTFGYDCSYNTFGSSCYYLKISDNTGTQKKYISVDSGVQGASSANQFDLYYPEILNKDYQVTFKKSASGKYLMLWATDTGTMTGKYKSDNTDTAWKNII